MQDEALPNCEYLGDSPSKRRRNATRRGQAALEYALLVAMATLIFGAVFSIIRQNLYKVWVCEIAARVQAPSGCRDGTANCFQNISNSSTGSGFQIPPLCGQ